MVAMFGLRGQLMARDQLKHDRSTGRVSGKDN